MKTVVMERDKNKKIILAYNIKKLQIHNDEELSRAIGDLFGEIAIFPDTVNLSISGPEIIVRFINLPKMNKEQVVDAMAFEAEKYIPFNMRDVVLDVVMLGDAEVEGQIRVLLAAAKRSYVERYVKLLTKINIGVSVMDTDAIAMFNAFLEAYPRFDDKGTVFLNIGHSKSEIVITMNKLPCFIRDVPLGGRDITEALYSKLGISPEKTDDEKADTGANKIDDKAAARIINEVLDELIREIRLSFGYFENKFDRGINEIYCSGGMIYQKGVLEYLALTIDKPVRKWNPLENIKISDDLSKENIDAVSSQLAVSIGLALRN